MNAYSCVIRNANRAKFNIKLLAPQIIKHIKLVDIFGTQIVDVFYNGDRGVSGTKTVPPYGTPQKAILEANPYGKRCPLVRLLWGTKRLSKIN